MEIVEVKSKGDLKRFVELPYQLYRKDPVWVPPLKSEQWSQLDPNVNLMLKHCTYRLFLAVEGERVLGRISAFTDRLALDFWKEPVGLFGSYECVADETVSRALLDAARNWLKAKGMSSMRGPWSFASQEWGLVYEGFKPSPVILAPYNPPYYNDQLVQFGLQKAKDLLVYVADENEGYRIPSRILEMTDKIEQRLNVHVRRIDMHRVEEEVANIVHMSNFSINDNWGYYPVPDEEAQAMARDLKQIVNPKGILIAEDGAGKSIGFVMALPDINLLLQGMNGSLLPFGWLKMLTGLPRLNQYRLWALGVVPEYQGRAVDALLYRSVYENLHNGKIRMEINYVLEDNDRMNNALVKLGAQILRKYRVYQMEI